MDQAILYNIILSKHAMSNHLLVSRKGKHPKIVVEDLSREYQWRPLMLKLTIFAGFYENSPTNWAAFKTLG